MASVHILTMRSNNGLAQVATMSQRPQFTLFQQCAPKITSGHAGCLVPGENATDMDGPHKVFSALARL
jgi:hypothetical protein